MTDSYLINYYFFIEGKQYLVSYDRELAQLKEDNPKYRCKVTLLTDLNKGEVLHEEFPIYSHSEHTAKQTLLIAINKTLTT